MEEQTAFPPKYQGSGAKARSFHFSILDLGERRGGGLRDHTLFQVFGSEFFFLLMDLGPGFN